ncbi:MAG: YncE family protein [Anaerolineae bacterium]
MGISTLKEYRSVVVALSVAGLALTLFVVAVGAVTKTPPYVITIASTGDTSTPGRVGVDPVTGRGYVLDNQGKVWIFSGTEVLEELAVPPPKDVAVDPGRYVYVTSQVERNPVTVLDAWSGEKTSVSIGTPSRASGAAAVLTTTHYAYVTLPNEDAVAVLSGTTLLEEAIPVGQQPVDVAADPASGYVYVVNQQDETVSVLQDTEVITTVTVGASPAALDVNPQTGYVYVVNSGSDSVTVIDSGDHFATTTVAVGTEPAALSVDLRRGRVYVAEAGSSSLSVLEGKSRSDTINLGDAPIALDVNPVTGYVYVVGGTDISGTITVLSSSLASETYVPVGHSPQDVGVLPLEDGDWAYAAMYKGTGGDEGGRIVILGRTAAARLVVPREGEFAAKMTCQGSGGPVDIVVPPQGVTEAVDLICTAWEPDTAPRYLFAGQGFLLKAYLKGAHQPGIAFNPPLEAGVAYPTPPADTAEEDLELRVGVPGQRWGTEGISVTAPPDSGVLGVTLAHLPENALAGYAVVVPRTFIYLPLVMRNYR